MENTVKMTVYEALQEVKLLDSKINKMHDRIAPVVFCPAVKEKDVTADGDNKETVKENATAWMDKYTSYVNRLNLLRMLIYESNLKTTITVAGKEYSSLAAAITRYNNIGRESDFWESLYMAYRKAKNRVQMENDKRLDPEYIKKAINPTGTEYTVENLALLEESYRKSVEQEVYDPLELMKNDKLLKKLDEVKEFKERFHIELNKVNMTTIIEVPIDEPVV